MANFVVPPTLQIQLVAAEPMLANPVAMDIAYDGTLYVAETFRQETEGVADNRTFPEWLEDDLQLQTVEQRAQMFLRHHPELAEEWTDHDDRIQALKDKDGDGVMDESILFAHGFHHLVDGTGAGLLARGKDLYYTCIPNLWLLHDENGDNIAESGKSLHYGFGVRVAFRGHDMHGLVIGPRRRLYFSIGDRGYHVETERGTLLAEPGRGAVFRCNLDGTELEVLARGLRNPQELAFDDFGNLFTVDNNCDAGDRARLVHVLEGGDSGWRMNFQYLPDRGPWMSEEWWKPVQEKKDLPLFLNAPIANLASGPSGLAAYLGVGLGPEARGSFFLCDFLGGAEYSGIRRFRVQPQGASFRLQEEEEYWWGILATDVCFGPDGSLYASDWVRGWVGDGYGRIYRAQSKDADSKLMKETREILAGDFSQADPNQLQAWLSHPDRRVRFEAQWALVDLGEKKRLWKTAEDEKVSLLARIHALWGISMMAAGVEDANRLCALAKDKEEQIRIHAVQSLRYVSPQEEFASLCQDTLVMALMDSSFAVRREALYLWGTWAAAQGWGLEPIREFELWRVWNNGGSQDRTLMQTASWALAKSPHWVDALRRMDAVYSFPQATRLTLVLALRRLQDASIQVYLHDPNQNIRRETACAIFDEPIEEALPALAASLDVDNNVSEPLLRRAAAACNLLGTADDAARLYRAYQSPKLSAKLREEIANYIRFWDRPKKFDPVLNEAREFGVRALSWFDDKDLSFPTERKRDAIERGRDIFLYHSTAGCTRCHSVRGATPEGRPNPAGPDLSTIGLMRSKEELLESIIKPSASLAPGFGVVAEGGESISPMPANFEEILSAQQIQDLVEFLSAQKQQRKILVHVDSRGYEHAVAKAGADGLSLVEKMWMQWAADDVRFQVTVDRSYQRFNDEGLADIDAVFFYTTGELPLSAEGKSALLRFVREGGTLVGAHCAADTFYDWKEYGAMLGAYFDGHPWHQKVRVLVEDPTHPAVKFLPSGFSLTDEIYQFRDPYSSQRLHVILQLDLSSVPQDPTQMHRQDKDYALAWERAEGKGGVFYTALGHRAEVWTADWFRRHLVEGTLALCDAPPSSPVIPTVEKFDQEVAFAPGISLQFAPVPREDKETLWVSTTEVPWELYDLFFLRSDEQSKVDGITGPSRSVFPVTRGYGHDHMPALGMTFHAAKEFCRWLSERYQHPFRLPTEKEWMLYSAEQKMSSLNQVAWFADNSQGRPHKVASLQPNPFGLYDVWGNLSEWVLGENPKGMAMGGNFLSPPEEVGPSAVLPYRLQWQSRDPQWPKSSWWLSDGPFIGFRIVTAQNPKPINSSSSTQ